MKKHFAPFRVTAGQLIAAAGGREELAAALGMDPLRGYRCVCQWVQRGVPAWVLLDHAGTIADLMAAPRPSAVADRPTLEAA